MRETEKQVWFCEQCQQISFTMMDPGINIWSAVTKLGQAHRQLSPACPNGMRELRIINAEIITTYERLAADSSIPRWSIDRLARGLGFATPQPVATGGGGENIPDEDCCARCNRRVGREALIKVSLSQGERYVLSVCPQCRKEFRVNGFCGV